MGVVKSVADRLSRSSFRPTRLPGTSTSRQILLRSAKFETRGVRQPARFHIGEITIGFCPKNLPRTRPSPDGDLRQRNAIEPIRAPPQEATKDIRIFVAADEVVIAERILFSNKCPQRVLRAKCLRVGGSLFKDLIRPLQERWGDRQAEGFGSLEIEHQFVRRRLLHRQVGGLLASQDLVDEDRSVSVHLAIVRSVGHEAACLHEQPFTVNRGQVMLCRKVRKLYPVIEGDRVRQHGEGIVSLPLCLSYRSLEIARNTDLPGLWLNANSPCRKPRFPPVRRRVRLQRVPQDGYARDPGEDLLEQAEPFPAQLRVERAQAGNVPTGPGQ